MATTMIIEKSTIKGNVILLADYLNITSESMISSQNSGCTFSNNTIGTPNLFVSHSFNCGLNAGSYGGRGGIGISDNFNDTFECIKNGFSRMTVYGDPLLAVSSGSTGSPFSIQDKTGSSPGSISIIVRDFYLQKLSKVQSGYTDEYKGTPASSGGSVSIIALNMLIEGKITANGQSAEKELSGEGGGGRISFYKICWHDANITSGYGFDGMAFEASAGKAARMSNESLEKLLRPHWSKIRAENGSNRQI